MKKTIKGILILFLVFMGLSIGIKTNIFNGNFEDRKNQFEDDIITPGNDYQGIIKEKDVQPNIFNDIGKKGEKAIEKVFDISFGILKKIID